MTTRRPGAILGVLLSMLGAAAPSLAQPDFQVLHDFPNATAASPSGLIEAADGSLYGATTGGGRFGLGTIFRTSRQGDFVVLHEFEGPEGANPSGRLLQASDGNFYGVARGGIGFGTVFRLAPDASVTALHVFSSTDGELPSSLIQATDGVFYGATDSGGSFSQGTLFKIDAGGQFTTLHHFRGAADGRSPSRLAEGTDGAVYGMTRYGGSAPCSFDPQETCGYGTAFRMTPDGVVTVIHHFGQGTEGRYPQWLVRASDGTFIGATESGAALGRGTLFRMGLDGSIGVVRPWQGSESTSNWDVFEARDGTFYGTSSFDSTAPYAGLIFRLSTAGVVSILHRFVGGADGMYPRALIQARDGAFFGTTSAGGYPGLGTVFRMDADGTVTTLHMLTGNAEGAGPDSPLIQASDGMFYGTTVSGGIYNHGTIFRITPGGELQTLYTFSGAFDGGLPRGALLQASDGHLYGTTSANGAYNQGVLYRLTLDGTFTALHGFNRAIDGDSPTGGLVQGIDGLLYGTTSYGGAGFYYGAVFRSTLDGDVTVLYSFSGKADGGSPGPLVQDADGDLYGTTNQYSYRTIFKVTPAGVVTTVHQFTEYTNGAPGDVMVRGADGNVYGNFGCNGGIFRFGPAGYSVLTLLGGTCVYDFGPPVVRLAAGTDGLLYATVGGSVYAVNLGGFSSLIRRIPFYDVWLTQDRNGQLYGTSPIRGAFGAGAIFRLTPKPAAPTPLAIASAAGGTVHLSWGAMANAASYAIRRRTTSGGSVVLASGVIGLRFHDPSVMKGQRYYYTITAVNQFGESLASYEVSTTPGRAVVSDFNGDGISDPAVFRPSSGEWFVFPDSNAIAWGGVGDIPVAADYSGDGVADVAVFRPSTGIWYVRGWGAVTWGANGDIPVPGYYRGGDAVDLAIYRPSTGTWHIRGVGAIAWGGASDVPVPGDYDGDGLTDVAVFRPSNFTWYIRYAAGGSREVQWGSTVDVPVPGDYDADGRTDVAVYRPARQTNPCCISPGQWFVQPSRNATYTSFLWGDIGDTPLTADYDGDGQSDVAVFRPSTGEWLILRVGPRTGLRYVWGGVGDTPISERP